MVRKSSALVLLLLAVFFTSAQSNFQEDFRFLKHLEGLEEWKEGLLLIDQLDPLVNSSGKADTLNFFRGKFNYKLKQPEVSVAAFRSVTDANPEYYRYARFFGAFQSAYSGDVPLATNILNQYAPVDSLSIRIKNLQLAGLSLLNRDYANYLERQSRFTLKYELEPYELGLMERYKEMVSFRKKSPFGTKSFTWCVL